MIKEDRDASLLRMFDAFIESVPQLIIQIYIALQHKAEESLSLEILRSITIASSLASLSWSVTSYYRNLRIFHATSGLKANSICGAVGYFLWRVFEIGPRITAIVMLLSVDSHGLYIIFGSIVIFPCIVAALILVVAIIVIITCRKLKAKGIKMQLISKQGNQTKKKPLNNTWMDGMT
uniref:XK-related protein n=1 Tax=Magallana gigas TaxID=29159 RepID=K1PQ98_MAGGI